MAERAIDRLVAIMAALRDPDGGCPWDREQTFATVAPYTVEEAYEVADAIERGDFDDLREELGDLLLQVVFHARIAEEAGRFDFEAVAQSICEKMIRRHPHVFAGSPGGAAADREAAWETQKQKERHDKRRAGLLDDVPTGLPALTRAVKLSKRAARVGFVWPNTEAVLAKLEEELGELRAEIAAGRTSAIEEELGDLLFVCANLGRDLGVDPEAALRGANAKFVRRFGYIEQELAALGRTPAASTLEEMDGLWNKARAADKAAASSDRP